MPKCPPAPEFKDAWIKTGNKWYFLHGYPVVKKDEYRREYVECLAHEEGKDKVFNISFYWNHVQGMRH